MTRFILSYPVTTVPRTVIRAANISQTIVIGNEYLPAQTHDLVVAIARERGAEPQKHEHEHDGLARNQKMLPSASQVSPDGQAFERRQPAAQEQDGASSAEIRIMLAYSARKNTANAMPEYSTWKPATISDSPSATSNGARLVSATPEIK